MTTEEVKTYLRQVYKLDKCLQRERRNLEKLKSAAEYHSPSFETGGGGNGGDRIATSVSRIIDEEQRVQELTDLYTAKYIEIEQVIKGLANDTLEEILELRYLHGKQWEDIAGIMHYALRSVYEFHGQALQKIAAQKKIAVKCIELQ